MSVPVGRLLVVFGLMSAVLVFGTVGFRLVEGWELFDCFYMSPITLTTVFTPYSFIGHRLAQSMLRPHVLTFLDVASAFGKSELDLEFEQVKVSETSSVGSKTLEESRLKQEHGVIVLAVMKPHGEMEFDPSGDTRIEAGDVLIAMGERSRLKQMELELEA